MVHAYTRAGSAHALQVSFYGSFFPLYSVKRLNLCQGTYTRKRSSVETEVDLCSLPVQAKKKFYDTELENLERQQKQQIEKMEQDHSLRRREEAKRIRLEQERDHVKFMEQLKQKKKEVGLGSDGGKLASCICFFQQSITSSP